MGSHLMEISSSVLMSSSWKKGVPWLSPTGGKCAGVVSVSRSDGKCVAVDSLATLGLGADDNLPARSESEVIHVENVVPTRVGYYEGIHCSHQMTQRGKVVPEDLAGMQPNSVRQPLSNPTVAVVRVRIL